VPCPSAIPRATVSAGGPHAVPPEEITVTSAAGAAAVLLAAGCSSNSGSALPPVQAIALAANQARQINSFGSTLSVTMSGALSGTLAGTMRVRNRPSLLADADFSTLDFGGLNQPGGMHEILASNGIYLKMAAFSQQLHKPWVKISFAELQRGTGINQPVSITLPPASQVAAIPASALSG
jgi:hypothetical protein